MASKAAPFVWLLLMPPHVGSSTHQEILTRAPLAKWTVLHRFEGEADCTRFKFELWSLSLEFAKRDHLKEQMSDRAFSNMCCIEAS